MSRREVSILRMTKNGMKSWEAASPYMTKRGLEFVDSVYQMRQILTSAENSGWSLVVDHGYVLFSKSPLVKHMKDENGNDIWLRECGELGKCSNKEIKVTNNKDEVLTYLYIHHNDRTPVFDNATQETVEYDR